ncbi:MAG TPA: hypothetical protein VLV83_16045 [Acidobacteriota bacterium]|nr:hypothetical protein [Acidobacteriota bacterium]
MRIRLKHERLGELLAESRMSQNRWALRMGVSRSHLSMLVNGRRALGARDACGSSCSC